MSRQEQMRAVYQAFLARDFDAIADQLDPDVEYVNPDDAVEPGTRSGVEEFVLALRRLVRFITHGKESAIRLELEFGHLLAWRDGKICRLEWFRTGDEAKRELAARG